MSIVGSDGKVPGAPLGTYRDDPVVSRFVYDRTKEQRDFWKEYAEGLIKTNAKLITQVKQLREILDRAKDVLSI